MPNKRPCTTWSAEVFREVRRNKSRSSGVGRGQFWYTVNRRAVRGFPSMRHAAIRAWNAASKGGTSCGNSSRVTLVKSRNAIGRDCRSANRTPAMGGASCHCIVRSEAHHTIKRDKLNYAQVMADGRITWEIAREALAKLEVDPLGLDQMDHKLLGSVIDKFSGDPVGMDTLAASIR